MPFHFRPEQDALPVPSLARVSKPAYPRAVAYWIASLAWLFGAMFVAMGSTLGDGLVLCGGSGIALALGALVVASRGDPWRSAGVLLGAGITTFLCAGGLVAFPVDDVASATHVALFVLGFLCASFGVLGLGLILRAKPTLGRTLRDSAPFWRLQEQAGVQFTATAPKVLSPGSAGEVRLDLQNITTRPRRVVAALDDAESPELELPPGAIATIRLPIRTDKSERQVAIRALELMIDGENGNRLVRWWGRVAARPGFRAAARAAARIPVAGFRITVRLQDGVGSDEAPPPEARLEWVPTADDVAAAATKS